MKKCCGVHALRIAVGITMLALLLVGGAGAMKITVNASGGGDYTRIQDAINNASAGDTILVYSGIYHENVNVTKQLILRGIGNPVVDTGGSGSAITLAADGITLEGFTATGSAYDTEVGIKVTSSNNTLSGNKVSNNDRGIFLFHSNDNTLTGNNAYNNDIGFYLKFSTNNTLSDNNAANNGGYYGIYLFSSSNNTLSGNNATNNPIGIYMSGGRKNTLTGNNAYNNNFGISISSSSNNNTLSRNNASNNNYGIRLSSSSNNTLNGNYASNNYNGIYLSSSNNNTLIDNNASNNGNEYGTGISVSSSSNNIINGNMMTGNQRNFILYGDTDSDFDNQIDETNLVDGKPIYYIKGAKDIVYDSSTNAGTFYCVSCVNVTIKNLNLNKNGIGIFFWNTSKSRIQNVTASNNIIGIYLSSSRYNTLSNNTANSNIWYGTGISLSHSSNNMLSGNKAYNNGVAGISLSSSNNNTLTGNNVNSNNINRDDRYGYGIRLESSSRNTLSLNKASNNLKGIYLYYFSNHNKLTGNNASNNVYGIYLRHYSTSNKIYNNIFNNKHNVVFVESKINTWNTTMQSGTNIIRGSLLGGNFWANPDGTGFSQTCPDMNGDGICDKSYTLDAKNIDYLPLSMNFTKDKIPPKSVRNLKNVTYARNYINWIWKDPKDIDFKKVMVFIDGKFKKNVSKGKRYYNATNFAANTMHTISTWTVDMNGNINKTWTNHSAWTAK